MSHIKLHNSSWKSKLQQSGSPKKKNTAKTTFASKIIERNKDRLDITDPIVFLLIDVSTSMKGVALQFAKKGAIKFAEDSQAKGYHVGVITFGSNSSLVSNPTAVLWSLTEKIKALSTSGTTNMSDALLQAHRSIKNPVHRNSSVVLITDGFPNDDEKALDVARSLKNRNIHILTLGTEGADFDFLEELATSTELSRCVSTSQLISGITCMAKLLPGY